MELKVYFKSVDNTFVQGIVEQITRTHFIINNGIRLYKAEYVYPTREDVLKNRTVSIRTIFEAILNELGWSYFYYVTDGEFVLSAYKWIGNGCTLVNAGLKNFVFDLKEMRFTDIVNPNVTNDFKAFICGADLKAYGKTKEECREKNKIIFVDMADDNEILQGKIESVKSEIATCTRKLEELNQMLGELQKK